MNRQRRQAIATTRAKIEQAQALLDEARDELDTIKDEENDALEAMPESLREGERGEKGAAAVEALDSAISDLEAIDFDSITTSLETAAE